MHRRILYIILLLAGVAVFASLERNNAHAEMAQGASISSTNFRILDLQHSLFGGTSSASSSSFLLSSTIGDLAIGSSSFTNFGLRSGFQYYPKVTAPVLNTATAGSAQVALSWTAAEAFQGWSISGYNVCTKPSSGSYTCENVGNVTSFSKTGLSNGTSYDFKIEAKDAHGNVIAVSNEKNATPSAPASPPPGGGGGGGGAPPPPGSGGTIILRGTAYPLSTVNAYLDDALISSIRSDTSAKFDITMSNVTAGAHTINLNTRDSNGRTSMNSSFTVTVTTGQTVTLSDILLSPTIDISATQLRRGDLLRIFGQSQPFAEVNVHVASEETVTKVITNDSGAYLTVFDTQPLVEVEHTTKSRSVFAQVVSPFSRVLSFRIGSPSCTLSADLNSDCLVNLIDLSILLFWWNTADPRGLGIADINNDAKVNIVDFSIMLFQWTGGRLTYE